MIGDVGHKGGLTNPRPWRGQCRTGFSIPVGLPSLARGRHVKKKSLGLIKPVYIHLERISLGAVMILLKANRFSLPFELCYFYECPTLVCYQGLHPGISLCLKNLNPMFCFGGFVIGVDLSRVIILLKLIKTSVVGFLSFLDLGKENECQKEVCVCFCLDQFLSTNVPIETSTCFVLFFAVFCCHFLLDLVVDYFPVCSCILCTVC